MVWRVGPTIVPTLPEAGDEDRTPAGAERDSTGFEEVTPWSWRPAGAVPRADDRAVGRACEGALAGADTDERDREPRSTIGLLGVDPASATRAGPLVRSAAWPDGDRAEGRIALEAVVTVGRTSLRRAVGRPPTPSTAVGR